MTNITLENFEKKIATEQEELRDLAGQLQKLYFSMRILQMTEVKQEE